MESLGTLGADNLELVEFVNRVCSEWDEHIDFRA